jgi:hypothetical protein
VREWQRSYLNIRSALVSANQPTLIGVNGLFGYQGKDPVLRHSNTYYLSLPIN